LEFDKNIHYAIIDIAREEYSMKTSEQMSIIRIVLPLMVAMIAKLFEVIIGYNSLFAIINLVTFVLFVKGIINYIENKYDITILAINHNKTISSR
jgi:hypothetical protein